MRNNIKRRIFQITIETNRQRDCWRWKHESGEGQHYSLQYFPEIHGIGLGTFTERTKDSYNTSH